MMSYLVHVVTSLKLLMVNKMHIKMYISNTPKLLNPPRHGKKLVKFPISLLFEKTNFVHFLLLIFHNFERKFWSKFSNLSECDIYCSFPVFVCFFVGLFFCWESKTYLSSTVATIIVYSTVYLCIQ